MGQGEGEMDGGRGEVEGEGRSAEMSCSVDYIRVPSTLRCSHLQHFQDLRHSCKSVLCLSGTSMLGVLGLGGTTMLGLSGQA